MSFGTPSKHGKFYAGRSDDTPVNHDLLWRRRVTSEVELMKDTEEKLISSARPWARRDEVALVDAYARHGPNNYDRVAKDPEFGDLIARHNRLAFNRKWSELTAGGRTIDDLLAARREQARKETVGFGGNFGRELELKARLSRRTKKTARDEERLRKARMQRFAAEKRAAMELKRTRELKSELERLESLSLSPGSSGRGAGRSYPSPVSPIRSRSRRSLGGSGSPFRASAKNLLEPSPDISPTVSTVAGNRVLPSRNSPSRRAKARRKLQDKRHVQEMSYLVV